jgi:hypothetical protein
MNIGLDVNTLPKTYMPQMSAEDLMGSSQLPGYG